MGSQVTRAIGFLLIFSFPHPSVLDLGQAWDRQMYIQTDRETDKPYRGGGIIMHINKTKAKPKTQ